jgi:hypothetical protein
VTRDEDPGQIHALLIRTIAADQEEEEEEEPEPECHGLLPAPRPATLDQLIECPSNGTVLGTGTAKDGTVLSIEEAICPEELPIHASFLFPFQEVSGASGYAIGICGDGSSANCRLLEFEAGERFGVLASTPAQLGIQSATARYTVSAWAIDECGVWGDAFTTAFRFAGDCGRDGSCSVCDYCCNSAGSRECFGCLDPYCADCFDSPSHECSPSGQ